MPQVSENLDKRRYTEASTPSGLQDLELVVSAFALASLGRFRWQESSVCINLKASFRPTQ